MMSFLTRYFFSKDLILSFIFLLIAFILSHLHLMLRERVLHLEHGASIFGGMEGMLLRTPSVGAACICGCKWILIL